MKMKGVIISGTGSVVPPHSVGNETLLGNLHPFPETVLPQELRWVSDRLGIHARRFADSMTSTVDLAYEASVRAIRASSLFRKDLGMIVVATSSPEKISPSTACSLQGRLALCSDIPAFDISAACSGFVYALNLCIPLVSIGAVDNVLIVATEIYSKRTDFTGRDCIFFGDGAGAIILSRGEGSMHFESKADGGGTAYEGFQMPTSGHFQMNSKHVYSNAMHVLPASIKRTLDSADLSINDVTLLIPHQASITLIKDLAEAIDIPMHRVKTVMHKYGNIAGASIPIALDEAVRDHIIGAPGDVLLLAAVGGGWTWGTTLIRYEQ